MAINNPNFIDNNITIASGQTTSGSLDLQGRGLVAILMPSTFTGTSISFQISPDNVTFYDCYNTSNTQLTCSVTQGRAYLFLPSDLVAIRYIKIVSNVTEGGTRVLTLISRDLA